MPGTSMPVPVTLTWSSAGAQVIVTPSIGDAEVVGRRRDGHGGGREAVDEGGDRGQPGGQDRGQGARERADGVDRPVDERRAVEVSRAPRAGAHIEGVADGGHGVADVAGDLGEPVEEEGQRRFGCCGQATQAGEGDQRDVGAGAGAEEHGDTAAAERSVDRLPPGGRRRRGRHAAPSDGCGGPLAPIVRAAVTPPTRRPVAPPGAAKALESALELEADGGRRRRRRRGRRRART